MTNSARSRIVLAALAAMVLCSVAQAALKPLPGHVPAVTASLAPIGRLAADTRLDLAIGLPLRNQAALNALQRELYDPASANFHQYLTPAQFIAQFGPTEQDYAAVVEFARTNGLAVTHRHGNRVLLDANGKVSDIERAFHLALRTYRHPTEDRIFFAPDAEPQVAAEVPVLDISGLSDYGKPRPMVCRRAVSALGEPAAGSGPGNGFIGNDFRNAYAPGTTLNGFGQMVGLVEFSGYDPNDIFAYEAQAGLPNVPLQNVLLGGSIGDEVGVPDAEIEVCLDIEMALAMATNLSAVVVFEAPYNAASTAYWNDILNAMAASNQIKQFSSSWGFAGGPSQTTEQIFQQMAAQGQSFFQASGDGDAWTYPIMQPAESTNIIIVGGTTLSMTGAGGGYLGETVWNWGNRGQVWGLNGGTNVFWGSGGGVSTDNAIPYWQSAVNMAASLGSTTMRDIPDVALTADNVYVTHASGANAIVGGTSCAAPLWASFMALENQQAASLGNPPAGFINPAIYALGESTNYSACFNDITTGSNTWSGSPNLYYAVPGYDLCTGWGTPAGTNLIYALAGGAPDPLVITPLTGFVANGPAGGPFNVNSQTFTLKNAGQGTLGWSLGNTSAWISVYPSSGTLSAGGQANIAVSLTSGAKTMVASNYTAVVFFTNQTTQVAQPRVFTLQVGQSLVQDGGFESGSFCHWTLAGRTVINSGAVIENAVESPHSGYNPVHSGNYGAMFADSTLAVLYQTLPTRPGQKYLLSFWLRNPTGGSHEQFLVNWNTNGTATNTIYSLASPSAFAWTNFNFVVTATGTNTTLQFAADNGPNFFGLDDVSVTPLGLPPQIRSEPASKSAPLGCTVSFSVVAVGSKPLADQWWKDGNPLTAQTNATLTVTNFQAADLGSYSVVVTNSFGAVTSSPAVLSVGYHPPSAGADVVLRFAAGGVRISVTDLLANDVDTNGDSLTIIEVSSNTAAGGSVLLTNNWIYYAPPAGWTNSDLFTYLVSDGLCESDTGTVLVQVVADDPQPANFAIGTQANGPLQLSFTGIPGNQYQLLYSDSLANPNWQVLAIQSADDFGVCQFTDPSPTNPVARFYRASVSP